MRLLLAFIAVILLAWIGKDRGGSQTQVKPDPQTARVEAPKLDLGKPVFTADRAIICNQAAITRAQIGDISPEDLFGVFGSFAVWKEADRMQKVGCKFYPDGIPVNVARMSAPLESFIGVAFAGEPVRSYFTMAHHLRN